MDYVNVHVKCIVIGYVQCTCVCTYSVFMYMEQGDVYVGMYLIAF